MSTALERYIETFNNDGFTVELKNVFSRPSVFITFILKKGDIDSLDLSALDVDDFNSDPKLIEIFENNNFFGLNYPDYDNGLQNVYLKAKLRTNREETLKYIADNLLTDVDVRNGEYWMYVRDREDLASFFKSYSRDTGPYDIAKSVLSDNIDYEYYSETTYDVYEDVISVLNEENKNDLKKLIYGVIGDIELDVEDFSSDFFEEIAEVQANDGKFKLTMEDIDSLIDDKEAMNEMLDTDLSDIKSSLYSIHNNAYNSAYQDEVYNLVFDGLDEYFSSRISEEPYNTNDGKQKYRNYIRIRDFYGDVTTFLDNLASEWNDGNLDYYGSYEAMMKQLFYEEVLEEISFRIPDYPDRSDVEKIINEIFGDYL
jgi:hypothetical protein